MADDYSSEKTQNPLIWPYNSQFNQISDRLNVVDRNQKDIDVRLSKIENSTSVKAPSTEKEIAEQTSHFNYSITFINTMVGLATFVITAVGVGFAFLGIFGLNRLANLHEDVREKIEDKMIDKFQKVTSDATSKAYSESQKDIFELRQKLENLESDLRMFTQNSSQSFDPAVSRNETDNSFGV